VYDVPRQIRTDPFANPEHAGERELFGNWTHSGITPTESVKQRGKHDAYRRGRAAGFRP
jgi:hypothetical protein